MSESIRVVIADDHTLVREGIRHVLEAEGGITVVAEASTAAEAVALVQTHAPDVAIFDISMPGETGLSAAVRLRSLVPETRVLILSMYDNPEYVLESVRAGAHGYILKDSASTDLRAAVRAVHEGESYFSPPIAAKLTEALRGAVDAEQRTSALERLTGREREVLEGIAKGETNKEIANRLGISHRTVETHRESLMRKLRIKTVAGLTKFALETGLITS